MILLNNLHKEDSKFYFMSEQAVHFFFCTIYFVILRTVKYYLALTVCGSLCNYKLLLLCTLGRIHIETTQQNLF